MQDFESSMRRAFLLLMVVFVLPHVGCDTMQKKHESPVMVAAPRRVERANSDDDEEEIKFASKEKAGDKGKSKSDRNNESDIEQTSNLTRQTAGGNSKNSPGKNPWDDWEDDTKMFNAQVAATVNGAPVLNGDVLDIVSLKLLGVRMEMQKMASDPAFRRPGQPIPTPKDYEHVREMYVQGLIEPFIQKKLLVERLKSGLKPDQLKMMNSHIDEQFEKEIPRIKNQLKVTNKTELELALRAQGTSLQTVKDNFALDRLAMECIAIKSDKPDPIERPDLVEYYKTHDDKFRFPERIRWQQIQVSWSPPGSDAKKREAREKLETAIGELKARQPFDEVARKYSDGPTAKKGGEWNWLGRDELADTKLEELLFSLPQGKLSSIHETPNSFSVVRVTERQDAGRKPFEEVQEEIRGTIEAEQNQKRLVKFKQELFATAVVETKYKLKDFGPDHQ